MLKGIFAGRSVRFNKVGEEKDYGCQDRGRRCRRERTKITSDVKSMDVYRLYRVSAAVVYWVENETSLIAYMIDLHG